MTSLKIVWIILPLLAISSAYQVCYEKSSFGTYRAKYCSISCCGNSLYRYCCGSSYGSSGTATGLIIGIVCGVGSLIALIVGIVLCCVCCCRSSQGPRGQVVTTNQQLAVITTANTTNAAFAPNYGYPAQPPAGVFYPPHPGMAGPPPAYTPAAATTAPAYVPPQGYPPAAAAAAMAPPNAATSPKHTDEEHMYTALER